MQCRRDLENSYMRFLSAKETMHEHYFYIKAFDDYVFISLKLIACRFLFVLSGFFGGSKLA